MLTRKKMMLIGAFVLIVLFFVIYNYSVLYPVGTELTEKMLFRDLERIGKRTVKIKHVQLSSGENLLKKIQLESGQLPENSRLVEVFIQNKIKDDFTEPLEVEHAIRIWLYLKQRELPFPVIGVKVYIDESWVNDMELPVIIFEDVFEKLYIEGGINSQINDDKIIRKLTQSWIRQNNYQGREFE